MPAILTKNLSVINAENFVDSFINGDSNIYMAVGAGYQDGDNLSDKNLNDKQADEWERWEDEMNPPTPVDTISEQENFRNHIIGMKKIMINDIMIMVPRVEWKEGSIYTPINKDIKQGTSATNYYCINSNNEVWLCVSTSGSAALKGEEPFYANGVVQNGKYVVEFNSGYKWEFLYNITAAMVNNGMLLDNWMPVPFNKHGKTNEISNSIDASMGTITVGGTITGYQKLNGDLNANRTLGAYRVLVTCKLSDEGDKIPYNSIYRQIGLLVDPTNVSTEGSGALPDRLEGLVYAASDFDTQSGQLVYLENRRPVLREVSQDETLNLLLIF